MRVRKHRRDHNHGKNGFVAGNARYNRRNPLLRRGMGKARMSRLDVGGYPRVNGG
jgi:hypothetical protein